jgi:hypothetical protein
VLSIVVIEDLAKDLFKDEERWINVKKVHNLKERF